jgi:hypothetical protein
MGTLDINGRIRIKINTRVIRETSKLDAQKARMMLSKTSVKLMTLNIADRIILESVIKFNMIKNIVSNNSIS